MYDEFHGYGVLNTLYKEDTMETIKNIINQINNVDAQSNALETLLNTIIALHTAGMNVLLDVDQTVYDKGVWDVDFLNWMVSNGIPVVFASHGGRMGAGVDVDTSRLSAKGLAEYNAKKEACACPVPYTVVELESTLSMDEDGIPVLVNDMPICLKVVPEGSVLIDNMAPHYTSDSVIHKEYIV